MFLIFMYAVVAGGCWLALIEEEIGLWHLRLFILALVWPLELGYQIGRAMKIEDHV